MSNFVKPDWLYEHIDDNNLVVVDCRADLYDRDYGKRCYEEGHIRNAVFLDVKKDLSGEVKEHGGRSPLPDIKILKFKLEAAGIGNDKIVVAYDEGALAGAERFWWILKYLGHEKVYVLNGGIKAWIRKGYELTKEIPAAKHANFNVSLNKNIITDVFEVKDNMGKNDFVIVDSRAPERYRGEVEPIDKKAGHIPGAKNYYWKEVLNDKLEFKTDVELKKRFSELEKYEEIVLQCGSGIDGCGNFIAMDEIGFKPKLYVGSWSDWISYEENPIVKEEE
ncbi:sulfurtransferase [Clostridium sp. YIM B02515]|uniref:Sulfurtransferase n=1 Tax=Clostridium rhizosphaerae TaxID=2803861 RepID=A0ABS1TDQ3_9CLOT|nr:sulfurtransferase [Clostridium rhizosphaerae]MBL4937361.1 sulfurtransferase [Clostridium rhizosphaerae]